MEASRAPSRSTVAPDDAIDAVSWHFPGLDRRTRLDRAALGRRLWQLSGSFAARRRPSYRSWRPTRTRERRAPFEQAAGAPDGPEVGGAIEAQLISRPIATARERHRLHRQKASAGPKPSLRGRQGTTRWSRWPIIQIGVRQPVRKRSRRRSAAILTLASESRRVLWRPGRLLSKLGRIETRIGGEWDSHGRNRRDFRSLPGSRPASEMRAAATSPPDCLPVRIVGGVDGACRARFVPTDGGWRRPADRTESTSPGHRQPVGDRSAGKVSGGSRPVVAWAKSLNLRQPPIAGGDCRRSTNYTARFARARMLPRPIPNSIRSG